MFAQLMREMLTDLSFESFRAYSLDTIARLDEASIVTEDIRRDRLPKQALDPVLAELAWSLGRDPIAKDIAQLEVAAFAELTKSNQATIDEITRHIALLRRRLGQRYKNLCEQKILTLLSDDKKRVELRHATGFYCSHLVNLGYTKTFMLRHVEKAFFVASMRRAGRPTLTKFFRVFDNATKNFIVYTSVDAMFGRYLSKLDFLVYPSAAHLPQKLGHGVPEYLPIAPNQAYMFSRASAHDEDGAVAEVESILSSVRALAFIVPHNMNCTWEPAMYVARLRSTQRAVLRGQAVPLQRASVPPSTMRATFKSLTSYSGRVLSNFDEASTERILSSLNTSALARTSASIENQLISLWSAVEVLLSEPPRGTARIIHYAKLLLPCICLRYVRRQTVAVFNEMLIAYRKKFTRIVNQEKNYQGTDQHTKFAAILYLPDNEALRRQLLNICSDSPLARHRLWKLYQDYSSPRSIKAALEAHERRVEWQIHRIYRARNNLVHAGTKPNYLDSLVLNLDEYYRACLGTLVNRATREESHSDVDQLIAEIGIEYKIYMTYMDSLRKESVLSTDTFIRAVT